MELAFFIVTSLIIVGCAIAVMTTRNIVHCIFFLLVALIGLAGIYMMLGAQFLAAVQVFLYAGAITVLMLFVIMLTTTTEKSTTIEVKQSPFALAIAIFFWISMIITLNSVDWNVSKNVNVQAKTADLANFLFTKQALPFEMAGVILLAALVGAIYLAKEQA